MLADDTSPTAAAAFAPLRSPRSALCTHTQRSRRLARQQPNAAKMLNDENELVDLYLPRKW